MTAYQPHHPPWPAVIPADRLRLGDLLEGGWIVVREAHEVRDLDGAPVQGSVGVTIGRMQADGFPEEAGLQVRPDALFLVSEQGLPPIPPAEQIEPTD